MTRGGDFTRGNGRGGEVRKKAAFDPLLGFLWSVLWDHDNTTLIANNTQYRSQFTGRSSQMKISH